MTTKEFRETLQRKPESEVDAQFFLNILIRHFLGKIGIPCIGFKQTLMQMLWRIFLEFTKDHLLRGLIEKYSVVIDVNDRSSRMFVLKGKERLVHAMNW